MDQVMSIDAAMAVADELSPTPARAVAALKVLRGVIERYAMDPQQRAVPAEALAWIVGDDTGSSSEAIWCAMIGIPLSYSMVPYDPSDLGRCVRLLEQVPAWRDRVPELANLNAGWAAYVARWDELTALLRKEVGADWARGRRAPQTYELMQQIRMQAESTDE